MKSIYFFIGMVILGHTTWAQPVSFQNADERPGQAYKAEVKTGSFASGPGSAGVNQVWDFSNMTIGGTGEFIVLNTSNNLYKNSYPNANYVYIIDSAYNYFTVSDTDIQMITNNIATPGGITDYSVNPKTIMQFPFSYGVQFMDTYMGVNDTGTHTVTVEYDGTGKLIMPNGKYKSVARVSETYATGVDYVWYSENPFLPILRYEHQGNIFTHIVTPPTSTNSIFLDQLTEVYPNPATSTVTVHISHIARETDLNIRDLTGRIVLSRELTKSTTTIDIHTLPPGMYVYTILQEDKQVTGKLLKKE